MPEHIVAFIKQLLGIPVHYQHVDGPASDEFAWCVISGEDFDDDLDDDEPFAARLFFDVEIYAQSAARSRELAKKLKVGRDYRGLIAEGAAFVDDVAIENQRDGYQPQAAGDSIPPFEVPFLLTVTGYEPREGE
ncbi:MAG TPA: hypothetical protein DDW52_14995 [Planctomycetaceae bacterium]|nr:hypothetical protein [Planctomycetaceae bacterium]